MMTTTSNDPAGGGDEPASPGRRERSKRDKQQRIFAAAAALFAEHGYSAVTTQQIADAADVGTGTVFRYAKSKADLLVQVMNQHLRLGAQTGVELAAAGANPVDAILALLAPLAQASLGHPENTVIYQRETLFGDGTIHRDAAAQVAQLEDAIVEVLRLFAAQHPVRQGIDLRETAHAIYSTMYMDLVRVGVGRASTAELPARLRKSINFLIQGLLTQPTS